MSSHRPDNGSDIRDTDFSIVIIDHDQTTLRAMTSALSKEGYNLRPSTSLDFAIKSSEAFPPDLIILNAQMPDTGTGTPLTLLRQNPKTADVPIIFTNVTPAIRKKMDDTGEVAGWLNASEPVDAIVSMVKCCFHTPGNRPGQSGETKEGSSENNAPSVLVVDDEEALVELMQELLKLLGYRASGTTSPIEALDLIGKRPEDYDLVITDQTMPEMDGIRLARRIHEITPDLPVILFSGYDSEGDLAEQALEHVSACLQKPVLQADLDRVIKEVLSRTH